MGKWNYESVKAEASKYDSRNAFQKGCNPAYQVARINGWLDEWFGHQLKSWDYESVKAEASKYDSRYAFQKGCIRAYQVARINGWLDEFFPKKNRNRVVEGLNESKIPLFKSKYWTVGKTWICTSDRDKEGHPITLLVWDDYIKFPQVYFDTKSRNRAFKQIK